MRRSTIGEVSREPVLVFHDPPLFQIYSQAVDFFCSVAGEVSDETGQRVLDGLSVSDCTLTPRDLIGIPAIGEIPKDESVARADETRLKKKP